MRKIIPLHLLCWNTVLQTKPVWLLTLSCLDYQKTRIFSTECWHSYTQMKDKFAAATHLICRICNLAGLWTSPAVWGSSVGCSFERLKQCCWSPAQQEPWCWQRKERESSTWRELLELPSQEVNFLFFLYYGNTSPFCTTWRIPRTKAKQTFKNFYMSWR